MCGLSALNLYLPLLIPLMVAYAVAYPFIAIKDKIKEVYRMSRSDYITDVTPSNLEK